MQSSSRISRHFSEPFYVRDLKKKIVSLATNPATAIEKLVYAVCFVLVLFAAISLVVPVVLWLVEKNMEFLVSALFIFLLLFIPVYFMIKERNRC